MARERNRKNRGRHPAHRARKISNAQRIRKLAAAPFIMVGIVATALALIAATGGTAYAMQREDHDSFCASCHTQPEVQFYQQSLQKNAITLADFHAQKNVRCIDCHSGGGPLGRISGLEQGFKDLMAYESGNYHKPAITTNKLGDGSCTKCHESTTAARDFNNHFHFFLSRWQAVDPNADHCVDCHTSHTKGESTQAFMSQTTVENICQNCHEILGGG